MNDKQEIARLYYEIEKAALEAARDRLQGEDVRASDIDAARKLLIDFQQKATETVVQESLQDSKELPFKVVRAAVDEEDDIDARDVG